MGVFIKYRLFKIKKMFVYKLIFIEGWICKIKVELEVFLVGFIFFLIGDKRKINVF